MEYIYVHMLNIQLLQHTRSEHLFRSSYIITLHPIGRPARANITLYPIGRPVRVTITLHPIGRPVRATTTLYSIGRHVRATITLYPIGRQLHYTNHLSANVIPELFHFFMR